MILNKGHTTKDTKWKRKKLIIKVEMRKGTSPPKEDEVRQLIR